MNAFVQGKTPVVAPRACETSIAMAAAHRANHCFEEAQDKLMEAMAALRVARASPVAGIDQGVCTASKAVWRAHDYFRDTWEVYQVAMAASISKKASQAAVDASVPP
jgi:hypothetical protein